MNKEVYHCFNCGKDLDPDEEAIEEGYLLQCSCGQVNKCYMDYGFKFRFNGIDLDKMLKLDEQYEMELEYLAKKEGEYGYK